MHKALREGLANALIHADYYGRRGIVIDKEFRKISISNPGTFRISVDEAIAGGISDARNGRIFNMFSLINVGERSGTGLCDVYNIWEDSGFRRPELIETVDPDRITLTLEIKLDSAIKHDGENDGETVGECCGPAQNITERFASHPAAYRPQRFPPHAQDAGCRHRAQALTAPKESQTGAERSRASAVSANADEQYPKRALFAFAGA